MATLLSNRTFRCGLLRLPPSIRASALQHATSHRSFSSTAPRKTSLIDIVVAPPTALLDTIHAIGIPWYATIPICSVLVRSTISYYVATLPRRKDAIVRANLAPLNQATTMLFMNRIARGKEGKPYLGLKHIWTRLKVGNKMAKEFRAPYITWNIGLNFGFIILFAEALQMKSGGREGLASVIFGSFTKLSERFTKNTVVTPHDNVPIASPEQLLADRIAAAREAQRAKIEAAAMPQQQGDLATEQTGELSLADAQSLLQEAHPQPLPAPTAYADLGDPSMKFEGLPWCPDLTVADPTWILPACLFLSSVASTLLRPTIQENKPQNPRNSQPPPVLSSDDATTEVPDKPPHLMTESEKLQIALAEAERLQASVKRKSILEGSDLTPAQSQQRLSLAIAAFWGLIALNLPSAILLYIIPSFVIGWIQSRWLDIKLPFPKTIKHCKKPMRTKYRGIKSNPWS